MAPCCFLCNVKQGNPCKIFMSRPGLLHHPKIVVDDGLVRIHVHDNTRLPHRNSTASAMIMQLKETYGLKRVPMTDPL